MSNLFLISLNDTLSVYKHYAKIFQCNISILKYINPDSNDDIIYRMMERDCSITRHETITDSPPFPSTIIMLSKQRSSIITFITKGNIMVKNIIFDKNVGTVCHYENNHSWQNWIQNCFHSISICHDDCWRPTTHMIDREYSYFTNGIVALCPDNVTTGSGLPSTTVVNIVNSTISEASSIITQVINATTPMIYENITSTLSFTNDSTDNVLLHTTEDNINNNQIYNDWNIANIIGTIGGVITILGIIGTLIKHKVLENNTSSLEAIEADDQDRFYDAIQQIGNNQVNRESLVSYNNEQFYDAPPPKPSRSNQNTYHEHIYEELPDVVDHFDDALSLEEKLMHHQTTVDVEVNNDVIDLVGNHSN